MTLRQRFKCLFCGCQIKTVSFQRLKELEEEIEDAPSGGFIRLNACEMELVDWVHNNKPCKDAKDERGTC